MKIYPDHIDLEREFNKLDHLILDFVALIPTEYVIVSGYVAILLGRSRGSEDIDIILPTMDEDAFLKMVRGLKDFYCLNTKDPNGIYPHLAAGIPVRFAKTGTVIPNVEVKFAQKGIARRALKDRIPVSASGKTLYISPLELQIAYKEQMLKSEKDREDALHLREIAKDVLDQGALGRYEAMLK